MQGFMYRGIDAVMNALNPALIKHKVFVVPEVLEQTREERTNAKGTTLIYSIVKVKYTFFAEDGSSVSSIVIGEGMDSGDKATNKAMSIAFKYACFQVFCIPTEEMVDPDAESHQVQKKEAPKAAPQLSARITPENKVEILKEMNRTHVTAEQIGQKFNVKSIDDLPVAAFNSLMAMLRKMPTFEEKK